MRDERHSGDAVSGLDRCVSNVDSVKVLEREDTRRKKKKIMAAKS